MARAASNARRPDGAKFKGEPAIVKDKTDQGGPTSKVTASMERSGGTPIGPRLQDHIGRKLRAAYNELVQEPVPDKIMDVFKQLEAKERGDPTE